MRLFQSNAFCPFWVSLGSFFRLDPFKCLKMISKMIPQSVKLSELWGLPDTTSYSSLIGHQERAPGCKITVYSSAAVRHRKWPIYFHFTAICVQTVVFLLTNTGKIWSFVHTTLLCGVYVCLICTETSKGVKTLHRRKNCNILSYFCGKSHITLSNYKMHYNITQKGYDSWNEWRGCKYYV